MNWLKNIEPKLLATVITSVGGLVLAFVIFFAYQRLAEVKTIELYNAVSELNTSVASLKESSVLQVEATKGNTEAVKDLRNFILQMRIQSANIDVKAK